MSFEAAVHAKAIQLDHMTLEMCAGAGSGHPTSAMSLGHLATVLLYHTMRWVPEHPDYPTSDRLVLSEGHAVPIIYAAFADIGAVAGSGEDRRPVTTNDLAALRSNDSFLDGHPNPREGFPFFDAATGSLGQGLSVAAGIALNARLAESDQRIYCIIGDGESREGQIAEALDFIIDHRLTNVLPIFNCNGYGQAGKVSDQQSPDRMAARLEALGFDVVDIDGHEPTQIQEALERFMACADDKEATRPVAMVARTVKGWGAQSLQGGGWHGKPPTGEMLEKAADELTATSVGLTSALAPADEMRIYPPHEYQPRPVPEAEPASFEDAMNRYDMSLILRSGKFATRKAYGLALRSLGHVNDDVCVLDADVSNSTFAEWFAKDAELSDRFVE
ncbi:MAG: thiamine pyrophosphate-dependent enzyme, partial [Planctomycetota bacterium]